MAVNDMLSVTDRKQYHQDEVLFFFLLFSFQSFMPAAATTSASFPWTASPVWRVKNPSSLLQATSGL